MSRPEVPSHEPAERAEFLSRLATCLPKGGLLVSTAEVAPFECDGLVAYRERPLAVAIPETIEQVQAVLRLCSASGVPVVARGSGTGLSGGALPHAQGVLLVMSRFDRILAIDPLARTARLQPGVRNLAISETAAPFGLYYAPDPSSQIACSIGGNVAENAGGVHCLKYGLTVHNVLGVEIVLMSGERLRIGGDALDSAGYDLLALVCGSEGMLGVIVEVTVRLLPRPPCARLLLAAFGSVTAAGEAVASIMAAGIVPAGLEMMDALAIRAAEAFAKAGYPVDAAAILLCELDGSQEECEAAIARVEPLLRAAGASDVRLAADDAERMRFWSGRKSAFPAVGRLAPDYYCIDGTIPRAQLAGVLERIDGLSREYGLPVANVFHAGDGNLHPLILYDAARPGEFERTEELGRRILALCVDVGGTITGEHGVGVEKLDSMCQQFGPAELLCFHAVKQAFDPAGLLNPGKAVPLLSRCAEAGRMHVHGGKLPFPELERF